MQNTHTYTYTYTQYTQCTIKTYLVTNTPVHIIHRMYTSALYTHLYIVICEGATDYKFTVDWLCNRLVVQQIVVQRCNRLCICNVVGVLCMVSSDSRCVSAVCACSPVELLKCSAWHVVGVCCRVSYF